MVKVRYLKHSCWNDWLERRYSFALREHPDIDSDYDGNTYLFSRPSAESLQKTLPVAYLPRGVTLSGVPVSTWFSQLSKRVLLSQKKKELLLRR